MMKWIKKSIALTYVLLMAVMAMATVWEKLYGTDYAYTHVYGSEWFIAVWAVLASASAVYIFRRVKRVVTLALHLAFLLILMGAFVTHVSSRQGTLHLRLGESTNAYQVSRPTDDCASEALPFSIRLTAFDVMTHQGTSAAYDYESHFVVGDGQQEHEGSVSMNNIYAIGGYRLYQNAYDDDLKGSTLSVNYDPYGIPITYAGYALLFVSLTAMLFDPKGRFRRTLQSCGPRAIAALAIVGGLSMPAMARATTTLTPDQARQFSQLYINYNERICPVETFALDFARAVTGKRSVDGYSATQLLTGYALFADAWHAMPVIRVKSATVRQRYGLNAEAALADFFDARGYKLGDAIEEYHHGKRDKLHTEVHQLDETLMLIMGVRNHSLLRLFPFDGVWLSAQDPMPQSMPAAQQHYVRNALTLLADLKREANDDALREMLGQMLKYQHRYAEASLPSPLQTWSEHAYNCLPHTTILFIVCLVLGFLSLLPLSVFRRAVWPAVCFGLLTCVMALRWVITGTIPMANGYEAMLLMAWIVLLVSLFLRRRFVIFHTLGLLMAGFFLLVSHISSLSPSIGHVMPVLQSPLLGIHVSIIMMAYALLSITAVCGMVGLCSVRHRDALMQVSVLMHCPAMACLGMGIFVGAIWANISWGTYWSWDPKETWALITLMIYAIPLHSASLPQLGKARTYHAFMLLAFLTVIITYFGVNYLLGGMHAYA